MTLASIHSFETFGAVDGPGVRFVVFLQGCRMRCRYCHNPDTWKVKEENMMSAEEVLNKALRYKTYWGSDGGITVSGGEPLMQIDFLVEFFKLAKQEGIHTTIDTCGQPFTKDPEWLAKFDTLMQYTDLVMLDIKHIDNACHKDLTKVENTNILEMAKYLSDIKKDVWIRHVLVPTVTDIDEYLIKLNDFIKTLSNVKKVEVLPYHAFGIYKWDALGIPYTLKDIETPSIERCENAKNLLHVKDYADFKE